MLSKRLPILFLRLKELKHEFDFNNDGMEILLNHEMNIYDNIDMFSIEITYNRPRQVIICKDIFSISLSNEIVNIDFQRTTKFLLPFLFQLLPEKLNTRFSYSLGTDEKSIFTKLMSDLTLFFEKYKFSDEYYKFLSEE